MPDPDNPESASVIGIEACQPGHLLIRPIIAFLEAAVKGPKAAQIQANAAAFIQDFAQVTRGLQLPIPVDSVLQQWRQQILSPSGDLVRALLAEQALPGFTTKGTPFGMRRLIKEGIWPSANYFYAKRFSRWYMQLTAPDRVKAIRDWRDRMMRSKDG